MTKALPRRLEFLGIENLGASVTLLLRSYCALATFQLRLCYAIGDSAALTLISSRSRHDSTVISLFARALGLSQVLS